MVAVVCKDTALREQGLGLWYWHHLYWTHHNSVKASVQTFEFVVGGCGDGLILTSLLNENCHPVCSGLPLPPLFPAFWVRGPLCEPTGLHPISSLQMSVKKVVFYLHSFYYRGWRSDCLGLNSVVTKFSFGLSCHWIVLPLFLNSSYASFFIVSPSSSACGSWQNYRTCFFMKTSCFILLTFQLCPLLSQFTCNFFSWWREK